MPLSPAGARLKQLLELVRDALAVDATVVDPGDRGETLVGTFHGRELGLVIGKHGQTIDAIQYLASATVYRGTEEERLDVVVDAAGYRERRRSTLESLADRTASRVVSTGHAERARADERGGAQDRAPAAEGQAATS